MLIAKKSDVMEVLALLERLSRYSRGYTQYYRSLNSLISQDYKAYSSQGVAPVAYRVFEDVFKQDFRDGLWKELRDKREAFNDSEIYSTQGVGAVDKGVRDSECLYGQSLDGIKEVFLDKVCSSYKSVENFFDSKASSLSPKEIELNVYHKGVGFKRHTDKGTGDGLGSREITYLYYFYKEPKAFVGGDLVLFDTNRRTGGCGNEFTRIKIENNMLLFFPSDCWHQVTQLKSEGADFYSGRFTLNGWMHSQ